MQGGYYRLDYQSRQWLADVGIDEVRSVSGLGTNTTFLTGDARYQLSRDWGVGGVANVSRTDGGTNWSLEGYVDHVNAWGTGRVQADFAELRVGPGHHAHPESDLVDARRHAAQHLDVGRAHQRRRHQWAGQQDSTVLGIAAFGGGQFTTRLEYRGQRALGDRRARPRRTGRVRQCLVDLSAVAELGDPRHLLRQPDRILDAARPWSRR